MSDNEIRRLSRLTAILTQLQTKRLMTSTELSERFSVSIRTIYRDIRALEQAGIPIVTEEGKGYRLIEGYRLPPIMFTEAQAFALILAEQLVFKNKDASFVKDYTQATDKVRAVLNHTVKEKASLLTERTRTDQNTYRERNSDSISALQYALTHFYLTRIEYTNKKEESSVRIIEPFALVSTDNWLLIAYCRLREEFRFFRLDRIKRLEVLKEKYEPHPMSLQDFFDTYY